MCACVRVCVQATVWKDVLERNPDSVRASIEEMEEIKSDLEKEMVRFCV